ncbi:MAG: hypothetical protein AAFV01_09025, partial [Bacteroidota bacterium]
GWMSAPSGTFVRDDEADSRDAVTYDGVNAQDRLTLRVDLAPGSWRVRFWLDGGRQDSSLIRATANGAALNLDWLRFHPPAEPQEGPGRFVREHASVLEVGDEGLTLDWTHPSEAGDAAMSDTEVRLLGVSFMPAEALAADAEAALRALDTPSTWETPLDGVVANLTARAEAGDLGAALWRDRVATLDRAYHDLWVLRGYEANIDSTGLSLIQRNVQTVMSLDGLLTDLRPGDPLYDRALWDRARAIFWLYLELTNRGPLAKWARDFADLHARYPADPLLATYARVSDAAVQPVDWDDACDGLVPDEEAPAWAAYQREMLCRMADLTAWWVANRERNGEIGGKLGDDVELLRRLYPVALAGDAETQAYWRRLADAVWDSPKILDGYFRQAIDVEHASEPVADAQPQLLVYPGQAEVGRARTAPSARHMRETWTVEVPPDADGNPRRLFRSAWFGTYEVDERPPRNRDLAMNNRATRAVRYYAWASGDLTARQTLHEWARAWRDAAARTDKGKPVGVYPASMRAADLALNGDEPTWHDANMFWPYFEWPYSRSAEFYDAAQFAYSLTGDSTLLAPMHTSLDLIRAHEGQTGPTGSAAWAADLLAGDGTLWSAVAQWRLTGGDARHDDLLLRYGPAAARARLLGDEALLAEALAATLGDLRVNQPLRRSEALYTDRIFRFVDGDGQDAVVAMLTGGFSTESPSFAVTWDRAPYDLARNVTRVRTTELAIDLVGFGAASREATAALWSLTPGRYRVQVEQGGTASFTELIDIEGPGHRVTIEAPPGRSTLTIEPAATP